MITILIIIIHNYYLSSISKKNTAFVNNNKNKPLFYNLSIFLKVLRVLKACLKFFSIWVENHNS